MKKTLILLLLLVPSLVFAVPARRVKKTITLADGTKKTVVMRGDEFGHYLQAEDGTLYGGDEKEGYRVLQAETFIKQATERSQRRNAQRVARTQSEASLTNVATQNTAGQTDMRSLPRRTKVTGKKKGLVILVNFSDKKMTLTQSVFDNYFNQEGYSGYGMAGSVHDYFKGSSYGLFDLTFDVVGPVTLSKTLSYYGSNDSSGQDKHPAEMVIEAVKLADAQGVNFSDYDWDGNGEVDQVYVIYAGYGEASGAPANTIWPHEYELSSSKMYGDGTGALKLDGVTIDTYACSNELFGTSGKTIDGIGTACHEFSHCLGIPDMYDTTTQATNFGMNAWDLMDYGCYGGDGYAPCGYTSYERWISGWLTPIELTDGCEISDMPSLDSSPTAYIIYNKANKNEYYLLENRQQVGWHSSDYGHGLLVLHVDYSSTAWRDNTVNNVSSHQRMTIIPADNKLSATASSLAGDPYPGTSKNTKLTNTSTPAATLFNANSDGAKKMNAPIENITENTQKKTISFTFDGGTSVEVPTGLAVKDITSTGFTAFWTPVTLADSYQLELTENDKVDDTPADGSILLAEDFSGFATGSSDGMKDISSTLDDYTKVSGWTGSKLFTTAGDEVKVGSSSSQGYLTTPVIQAPSGESTIEVTVRPYSGDNSAFFVAVGDMSTETINITEETTYAISLTGTGKYNLSFVSANQTKCRFYISDITVYDGNPYEVKSSEVMMVQKRALPKRVKYTDVTTTNCSYTFTDLNPEMTYKLKVRTSLGGKYSLWSDEIDVVLNSSTDKLEEISANAGRNSDVYNLNGQRVQMSNAKRGIYISNGKLILR